MKRSTVAALVVAMVASVSVVFAADIKSGLKSGDSIDAFYVTKLAGASDDGVDVGKNLCYRCKNGARPQVMIFTRSSDEKVVSLVKELDAAVAKNSGKQLRVFVNYLGEDKEKAKADAEKLAATSKAKNVPFVLPNEFENGPDNYGINSKAEVTVILATNGTVKANHAAASAKDLKVSEVVGDLAKILE